MSAANLATCLGPCLLFAGGDQKVTPYIDLAEVVRRPWYESFARFYRAKTMSAATDSCVVVSDALDSPFPGRFVR